MLLVLISHSNHTLIPSLPFFFFVHPFLCSSSLSSPAIMVYTKSFIAAVLAGLIADSHAGLCRPNPSHSSLSAVTHSELTATASREANAYPIPSMPTGYPLALTTESNKPGTSSSTFKTTYASNTASSFASASTSKSASELASNSVYVQISIRPDSTSSVKTLTQIYSTSTLVTSTQLYTTSSAEPSTASLLSTTIKITTTVSSSPATTSHVSLATCPPKSSLACGTKGYFSGPDVIRHVLVSIRGSGLDQCKALCLEKADCVTFGITDAGTCELYDALASAAGFVADLSWWNKVYEMRCFESK